MTVFKYISVQLEIAVVDYNNKIGINNSIYPDIYCDPDIWDILISC